MGTPETMSNLRRRPDIVRYYYLAVSENNIHTGVSYGGLDYVEKKHGVKALFLSDLSTKTIVEVTEPVEKFMEKWRNNYNDPKWSYGDTLEKNPREV